MSGLCPPLPTLRRRHRGRQRTARGRCGSLILHRSGLAPPTPCRSPGALRILPPQPHSAVSTMPFPGLREPPTFLGVRLVRRSLWSANSGLLGLDRWLCGASLCSPFSNFSFGIPRQGAAAKQWLAERQADLLAVPLLSHRVHDAGGDCRHRVPEQGPGL
jgi:hypothetical protein